MLVTAAFCSMIQVAGLGDPVRAHCFDTLRDCQVYTTASSDGVGDPSWQFGCQVYDRGAWKTVWKYRARLRVEQIRCGDGSGGTWPARANGICHLSDKPKPAN